MKDRKKRDLVSGNRFFWCTLSLLLLSAFFSTFGLSTFRIFGVSFRPVLLPNGRNPEINAVRNEHNASLEYSVRRQIFRHGPVQIQEAVVFPDQVVVFLKRSRSQSTEQEQDIRCFYYARNSMEPGLELSPISINGWDPLLQIVRCPPRPRGGLSRVSLWRDQPPVPLSRKWYSLAYESLIDIDNTTVVFVKGLNLRREKLTDASRFECVYGRDFKRGKFLRSTAVSVAQEVVRCPTPDVLLKQPHVLTAMRVSVNFKGRGILNSVARPEFLPAADVSGSGAVKAHEMCVCTMVRNQARFLREWVMYHGRIGVDRWFIYDNNSDDEIEPVLDTLAGSGFNATRHDWPWIKTQEAGFAHCAVRARHVCEWVGFIDVDEFLHLPANHTLHDVLRNHSDPSVGELRTACLNFGPSGLKRAPPEGVITGYTCRMAAPERHKSIIRPEALNATLVNVVHHFHLREGFSYVNLERGTMVINHYKYQVWEVFKEKFYRRVATYVSDWKEKENAGSKDRAPGLGTRPIEPPNWSTRFCEVTDNGLKKWALKEFRDPETQLLPWTIRD